MMITTHDVALAAQAPQPEPGVGPRDVDTATARLTSVLERAATLHLGDRLAWQRLTAEIAPTIDALIRHRVVPDHLAVRVGEPPVVVRRTVAAAWQHATGRTSRR